MCGEVGIVASADFILIQSPTKGRFFLPVRINTKVRISPNYTKVTNLNVFREVDLSNYKNLMDGQGPAFIGTPWTSDRYAFALLLK